MAGRDFLERVNRELGVRSRCQRIEHADGTQVLREEPDSYKAAFGAEMRRLGLETEPSPREHSG